MATPGTPTPGGAPQGAPPQANPGQGGQNPLQIIAAITRLAQMLASAASPTSPDSEAIIQSCQKAAQKIMGASQPQGGGGGPAPY